MTTLRRIKDILKIRLAESPMQMLHQSSALLHQSLVFTFTADQSNGLFAAMLADKQNFGENYLNVIQLRFQHLLRYMVASFLLGRSNYQAAPKSNNVYIATLDKDCLARIALPIILEEKSAYSDAFTQFTEALFEEFDFDEAIRLAEEISK